MPENQVFILSSEEFFNDFHVGKVKWDQKCGQPSLGLL